MRLSLLPLLACPDCGRDLQFSMLENYPRHNEHIEKGSLKCAGCRREFPIIDSIPRLLPKEQMTKRMGQTRQRFGWEWARYPGSMDEDKHVFLQETQIPEAEFGGKRCLDAGCGMGRYTLVTAGLGAEVVACDLSDAILRLIPASQENPKLHLVQADLQHPPFKPAQFDIIYSQGVIHHTPDTETTFRKLAPLVKPSGLMTVWVYGTPGSYPTFSTNPLREGRKGLKLILPIVWLVVWIRQIISDFIRIFTTRLPHPLLYALCYPITMIGAIPLVKYLTFSVHPNFRVRLIENFDWLAPPYQHKHTKEEMKSWFESSGFSVIRQLPHGVVPKIGALGRKIR